MRVRGLKQLLVLSKKNNDYVAPHAGAWIETRLYRYTYPRRLVAPHAGAWIETEWPLTTS